MHACAALLLSLPTTPAVATQKFTLQVNFTGDRTAETEGEAMVRKLQGGGQEVDRKLDEAEIRLFGHAGPISGSLHATGGRAEDASSEDEEDHEGWISSCGLCLRPVMQDNMKCSQHRTPFIKAPSSNTIK